MQIVSKRLGAIVLGACLLVALAFGGFTAFAAVTWQGSGFSNSLTVEATNNDTMKPDIDKANVEVDVYRVATAQKNGSYDVYDYTWEAPFGTGAIDISKLDNDGWQKLADDAAKEVGKASTDSPIDHVTVDAGAKLDTIDNGLYLLMAHGKDAPVTYAEDGAAELHAYSEIYDYVFEPVLVAVPNKAADEQGKIRTDASYGPWLTDVTVVLKPEKSPLVGSIKVTKTLTRPTNEMRSFAFNIHIKEPNGSERDEVLNIDIAEGAYGEGEYSPIPAGSTVTVTENEELLTGYRLVRGDSSPKTIVADRIVKAEGSTVAQATAAFENEPDGTTEHGYGIENKFVLTKIGDSDSAWDWEWISVPDQSNNNPEQS